MLPAPLLLAAVLAPADAPTPPPHATVSDAGELQGEWEVVGFLGKSLPDSEVVPAAGDGL